MNQYETHLTLVADDATVLAALSMWADESKLKWTQIVLDGGETPLQPMVTLWGKESLAEQHQLVDRVTREIVSLGGSVMRVKIEADLDNDEVPHSDADVPLETTNYFEHHIKVLLSDANDLRFLSQRAAECNARLSRNTRRQRVDGRFERFVTQRVYGRGRSHAQSKLNELLVNLSAAAFHLMEVEEEYVVFDSNLAVDAGWLEPEQKESP